MAIDNSVYVTLSRQMALLNDIDVTSNNIANMNTTGYDANREIFESYLTPDGSGGKTAYARDLSTFRDTSMGSMRETGNALDVAVGTSDAYFMVQTPQGRRFTRSGNFQIDGNGTLITQEGYPVLDVSGQQIQFEQGDSAVTIGSLGNITANGEERGTLAVVTFANPQALQRLGNHVYATGQPARPVTDPRVMQGMLEGSNVEAVSEMTHMISITRDFGDTAKFIQIMYDLQGKHLSAWTQQNGG